MNPNHSLEQFLFGPLDKKYCIYFYVLTISSFLFFLIVSFLVLSLFIQGKKKITFYSILIVIAVILEAFFQYIQNRLLYSMCTYTSF
jgi:ABC-type Fe3+-siderophore transport system permease subunit